MNQHIDTGIKVKLLIHILAQESIDCINLGDCVVNIRVAAALVRAYIDKVFGFVVGCQYRFQLASIAG